MLRCVELFGIGSVEKKTVLPRQIAAVHQSEIYPTTAIRRMDSQTQYVTSKLTEFDEFSSEWL